MNAPRTKATFLARLRASVWALPIAKLLLAVGGLALFAMLGRSAIAKQADESVLANAAAAASASSGSSASMIASPNAMGLASSQSPSTDVPILTVSPSSLPLAQPAKPTEDSPLILNLATAEDLMQLPGIGPKKAGAILALRQRLGKFHQVDDLLRVKGIGRNTLKRLRPLLRVDAPQSQLGDGGSPH